MAKRKKKPQNQKSGRSDPIKEYALRLLSILPEFHDEIEEITGEMMEINREFSPDRVQAHLIDLFARYDMKMSRKKDFVPPYQEALGIALYGIILLGIATIKAQREGYENRGERAKAIQA